MMRFANYIVVSTVALAACSKPSSPEAARGEPQTVDQHLTRPLAQRDASIQAKQTTGEAKPHNSAQLFKPLKEAHDDLQAKKYVDAISTLKLAEAITGRTPYDNHLISEMLAYAYLHTNDYANAAALWDGELNDGFLTQAEVAQKVRALSEISYQLKDYSKAISYGQLALTRGYGDSQTPRIIGQAFYLKGDWKDTIEFEGKLVSGSLDRGETPSKESLLLLYSACVKAQDNPCWTRAFQMLKRYYPETGQRGQLSTQPVGTVTAFFFGPSEIEGEKSPTPK
jgi:hypothetical protein